MRQETLRGPLRKRGKASKKRLSDAYSPCTDSQPREDDVIDSGGGVEQDEPVEKVVLERVEGREMEVAMIADRG